jgi:hypothetical protein
VVRGVLLRAIFVIGQLAPDGAIELVDLELDTHLARGRRRRRRGEPDVALRATHSEATAGGEGAGRSLRDVTRNVTRTWGGQGNSSNSRLINCKQSSR